MFGRRSRLLAPIAALLVLVGCAGTRGGSIGYGNLPKPDAPKIEVLAADYRIAPLDTLAIRVFRMGDLSGDYSVDLAGRIAMPLIGEVMAADLTPQQLDTRLTALLGDKYLVNPDVTVGVKASSTRIVTVDGSVARPGTLPILSRMTLMQAVALVGGLRDDSNARRIAIFRTIGGQRKAAAFDLTEIRRGRAPDPEVYAGDIIIVDGSATKALQRGLISAIPILNIFTAL